MKRAGETEALTLLPDEGEEETREVSLKGLVRRWHGSYAACRAARPAEGSANKESYRVVKTVLKRKRGGQGELHVYFSKQVVSVQGSAVTAVRDTFVKRWDRTARPLRQHKKWAAFTSTQWSQIDAWEKGDDPELKKLYKYRTPKVDATTGKWEHDATTGEPLYDIGEISVGETLMRLYCDKRLNGQETFTDFHPVVTRVRVYTDGEPEGGNCGKIAPSTGDNACPRPITGYTFLKVQDDITNQGAGGAWSRTEAWEGYEAIDADLYEATAGARSPRPAAANRRKAGGRYVR